MKSLNQCLEERIVSLNNYGFELTAEFVGGFLNKSSEELLEAVGRIKNQIAKFELSKAYAEYLKANGRLNSKSKWYRFTR